MSKFSGLPKLVNVSDTSDSESTGSVEAEKNKPYRSQSRSLERSRSGSHRSLSPSSVKEGSASGSREYRAKRSRSRSKGHFRHSRSHSKERRHRRHGSRERRRSRDRRRHRRSPSPRRHRRRSRSKSPRRHRSPRPSRSLKTMATLDKLGIELKPSDPTSLPTLNPARFSQQMAKRKLIWGSKSGSDTTSLWQGATFSQDQDGRMSSKFKRLMGIKKDIPAASASPNSSQDMIKRQQELFSSMEIQYEAARQATHTQRGVGLGFGAAVQHHP